jgi:predicted GIY-YIG superfamily endonuclease
VLGICAMHYVYVLIDPESGSLYYGYSADLKTRLAQHKRSEHPGWELLYYEAFQAESDARKRERKLKHYGAARGHLKARLSASVSQSLSKR